MHRRISLCNMIQNNDLNYRNMFISILPKNSIQNDIKNLILFLKRSCSLITKYKHQHFIKGAITKDEITACQTEFFFSTFILILNIHYPNVLNARNSAHGVVI